MNSVALDDFPSMGAPMTSTVAIQLPTGMQQVPGTPYFVYTSQMPVPAPVFLHTQIQPISSATSTPVAPSAELDEAIVVTGEPNPNIELSIKKNRLWLIVCSSLMLVALFVAVILDGLFTWPRVTGGSRATLFIIACLINMQFLMCNVFQLLFAVKDQEAWRSKMTPAGLALANLGVLCFCIHAFLHYRGNNAIAGLLLFCSVLQILYLVGLKKREQLRLQRSNSSDFDIVQLSL